MISCDYCGSQLHHHEVQASNCPNCGAPVRLMRWVTTDFNPNPPLPLLDFRPGATNPMYGYGEYMSTMSPYAQRAYAAYVDRRRW